MAGGTAAGGMDLSAQRCVCGDHATDPCTSPVPSGDRQQYWCEQCAKTRKIAGWRSSFPAGSVRLWRAQGLQLPGSRAHSACPSPPWFPCSWAVWQSLTSSRFPRAVGLNRGPEDATICSGSIPGTGALSARGLRCGEKPLAAEAELHIGVWDFNQ